MVIHVITRLALGGAQQMVYDLARRMHEAGGEVLILTGLSDTKSSLSAKNDLILDQVRAAGIPVEVCPYLSDRISPMNDARALLWLCLKLAPHRSAIVHIHSSKTGILARLACALIGVERVIYHVHGWSFSSARGVMRKLFWQLERSFYYLTTEYVFVCRHDQEEFVRLGGNPGIRQKSHVIYPGAAFLEPAQVQKHRRELRKKLGLAPEHFIIGSIGRLDYQKNPQAFVAIAAEFARLEPHARFVWIGDGQGRSEVEQLIERAGLAGKFILTGFVEDAEPYFSVFDTFVLTSRYEGLPVTVIKTLACGSPVVGFRVNGMHDLESAFRSVQAVPPGDLPGFVRALGAAQSMVRQDQNQLQAESRYVRQHYTAESVYASVMAVYNAGLTSRVGDGRRGMTTHPPVPATAHHVEPTTE